MVLYCKASSSKTRIFRYRKLCNRISPRHKNQMPIWAFYFYHACLDSNTRNGGSTRRRKADGSMPVLILTCHNKKCTLVVCFFIILDFACTIFYITNRQKGQYYVLVLAQKQRTCRIWMDARG